MVWRDIALAVDLSKDTFAATTPIPTAHERLGGGFGFQAQHGAAGRNRFVVWRASGSVLELLEISLDCELTNNALRIQLPRAVVGDVVFVEKEVDEGVRELHVLVVTTRTFHRFVFPHPLSAPAPDAAFASTAGPGAALPSVLAKVTAVDLLQGTCSLDNVLRNGALPKAVAPVDEDRVAIGYSNGSIAVVETYDVRVVPGGPAFGTTAFELKEEHLMKKLWSGLMPTLGTKPAPEEIVSLATHCVTPTRPYIFALCADNKIRVWDVQSRALLNTKEIDADKWSHEGDDSIQRRGPIRVYSYDEDPMRCKLGLYFELREESQLQLYTVSFVEEENGYIFLKGLEFDSFHYSKLKNLVDFRFSFACLWAMWADPNEGLALKYVTFETSAQMEPFMVEDNCWTSVLLHAPDDSKEYPSLAEANDFQDAYLEDLFKPGRYSLTAIHKAYQQLRDANKMFNASARAPLSVARLQRDIPALIQELATSSYQARNIEEEDIEEYVQLQRSCWESFRAKVRQAFVEEETPIALFKDPHTGLMIIIKKGNLTFARPCEALEALHAISLPRTTNKPRQKLNVSAVPSASSLLLPGTSVYSDPAYQLQSELLTATNLVSQELGEDVFAAFEEELYFSRDPYTASARHIDAFLSATHSTLGEHKKRPSPYEFIRRLLRSLYGTKKLIAAVKNLLELLDTHRLPATTATNAEGEDMLWAQKESWCAGLFGGDFTEGFVSMSLQHITRSRFQISRDLFFLLSFVMRLENTVELPAKAFAEIESELLPRVATLVKCYHLLHWTTLQYCPTFEKPRTSDDLASFSALEITGGQRQNKSTEGRTLMQLFVQENSTVIQQLFASSEAVSAYLRSLEGGERNIDATSSFNLFAEPRELWTALATPFVQTVLGYVTMGYHFSVFLKNHSYYGLLHENLRLSGKTSGVAQYLLGLSHLDLAQFDKATECFLHALTTLSSDEECRYFKDMLQETTHLGRGAMETDMHVETHEQSLDVPFLMHVIELFESVRQPEFAIRFAFAALQETPRDDNASQAFLWSVVFKSSLALRDYEQAYLALLSNPHPDSSLLRKYVVVLCTQGQVGLLCQLPFAGLQQEVVQVLTQKARAEDVQHIVDGQSPNYYEILYAYHVFRSDYRSAALFMHEYAMRLGIEAHGNSQQHLQHVANAYLTCLNAFRLVDPKFAWIHKAETPFSTDDRPKQMSKRKRSTGLDKSIDMSPLVGGKPTSVFTTTQAKEPAVGAEGVTTLEDIEMRYHLTMAYLTLIKASVPFENIGPSAFDVFTQLVDAGFFDKAITLAVKYSFNLSVVFEVLTKRCVLLQQHVGFSAGGSQGLHFDEDWSGGGGGLATSAWRMLKKYLKQYDPVHVNGYRKAVAHKILSLDNRIKLPKWLVESFKKHDVATLLYLYLKFGVYDDAIDLVVEVLDEKEERRREEEAGGGRGRGGKALAEWLPYARLEQLEQQIQAVVADAASPLSATERNRLVGAHKHLRTKLARYLQHVDQRTFGLKQEGTAAS